MYMILRQCDRTLTIVEDNQSRIRVNLLKCAGQSTKPKCFFRRFGCGYITTQYAETWQQAMRNRPRCQMIDLNKPRHQLTSRIFPRKGQIRHMSKIIARANPQINLHQTSVHRMLTSQALRSKNPNLTIRHRGDPDESKSRQSSINRTQTTSTVQIHEN